MEYEEKMKLMRNEWRNIPFTGDEIKALPLGFSATAFKPTNLGRNGSKFIPQSIYHVSPKKEK